MSLAASVHTSPDLVDAFAFREGLARLASGVAVVACHGAGGPEGLLVNSLTGLSTEPPRLLFCVRKAASAYAALLEARSIGVSLLDQGDRDEAERFATPGRAGERFLDGRWRVSDDAPPLRQGALASFSGTVQARIDAGTHVVFILDVTHVQDRESEPLVYFERDFRRLA